jgi:thiol-disulfide isomerase/thioredoxin
MNTASLLAPIALLTALSLSSVACSAGDDPAPASTGGDKCKGNGAAYPTGNCGNAVGSIIANYTFTGRPAGLDSPTQTIKFSDWYNPDGSKPAKFLVINVSALWCAYCKEEAGQIGALKDKYGPKGVVFLTDLAEKLDQSPADQGDVDAWIKTYGLTTAVVNDPDFVFGAFFEKSKMPLNMIIDLKTMTIVLKIVGSDLPSVTAKLDSLTAG